MTTDPDTGSVTKFNRAVIIGFWTTIFAIRSAAELAVVTWRGGRAARYRRSGQLLSLYFERLGPTFVKFGQAISTRTDLLHPEILAGLQRLQEHASPVAFREIEAGLRAAYGDRLATLFREIDPVAVGSGAIAQVHRAVCADGRIVALKICKPGVRAQLMLDAQLALAIAGLIVRLPMMRNMPMVEAMSETFGILTAQTDFAGEAASMRRLRENFRHVDGVWFPEIIEHLCTNTAIAMEYLDDLTRVDAVEIDVAERRRIALTGLRALYRMIFDHGFVHADLHPGNVFRSADGSVAILDAGLVSDVGEATRQDFVAFFFAVVNNHGREGADIVWRTAVSRPSESARPAFEAEMTDFIATESTKKSGEFEVVGFVHRLLDIQRRHGLRATPAFVTMVFAMAVYDGLCRYLFPGCDFQGEARGYLIAAHYRRFARDATRAG
ncbi:AarF/ABC1/UbiB kinase family protein [Bradyrhizobium liaoningense]|uniref:ABC1 kinase family protein n=1 Tax=Bradyrhizobium liaoningense TaxID=43992 RepID=UPI001BA92712|nr:AarF/UbiB family protein [Bradyrhizobium liaoningense]MBR1031479.1 AarF/ABC1/UbiB kinase family protein [Bradyrhizobium liaoningense]